MKTGTPTGTTGPGSGAREFAQHVSAVAAQGDGLAAGDWVYTTGKTVPFTGASFAAGFSSNVRLAVFGPDFQVAGRTRFAGAGGLVNHQFPKQLGLIKHLPPEALRAEPPTGKGRTVAAQFPAEASSVLKPAAPPGAPFLPNPLPPAA